MKHQIFYIVALMVSMVFDCRAITPREAFVKAPSQIFTTLDSISRLDMIDYFEAGRGGASRNALGGESRITVLDDLHVGVMTTPSTAVDIYLLPSAGKDTLVAVVSTLKLPALDSSVAVYDSNWNQMSAKKLPATFNTLDLWLKPGLSREDITKVENTVPFIPAYITVDGNTLTVTNKIDQIVPAEEFKAISGLLVPSIAFAWNGKVWSPVKKK